MKTTGCESACWDIIITKKRCVTTLIMVAKVARIEKKSFNLLKIDINSMKFTTLLSNSLFYKLRCLTMLELKRIEFLFRG